MVSEQIDKRKAINRHHKTKMIVSLVFLIVVVIAAIFGIVYFTLQQTRSEILLPETEENSAAEEPEPEPEIVLPGRIDFQPVVDEWAKSAGGTHSVLVYDLDRDEMVGEYDAERDYNTASLYKLFVVYEGYRRVQSGEWKADAPAGATGYTIAQCLDKAIRESHSPCAETLWAKIGHDELDEIIERDFEIHDSKISSLVSTPNDILKMMRIFYEHSDITDESLLAQMKDSFLNQPATEYNWRQGLPSGFAEANVYNKVGWDYNPEGRYWNIYHDAAIIEFPEQNRHYIIVVMTNRVPFEKIRALGAAIETEFNKY